MITMLCYSNTPRRCLNRLSFLKRIENTSSYTIWLCTPRRCTCKINFLFWWRWGRDINVRHWISFLLILLHHVCHIYFSWICTKRIESLLKVLRLKKLSIYMFYLQSAPKWRQHGEGQGGSYIICVFLLFTSFLVLIVADRQLWNDINDDTFTKHFMRAFNVP